MTAKSMWKWLRQHEKMILAGIVVFILPAFGFGGIMISWIIRSQEKTVAAVVDGREITVEEFNALKRRFVPLVDSFQRFVAGRYGAQREIKVENPDLWKHVAMVEEAGKSGIRVPETEVREIIEDYPKAYEKLPHLKNAYSFLSQKEILMYAQMLNYHAYFSIAMQDKYTKEKYEKFLTRFQLTDDAFRTTVREILTILKFKYFRWRTAIVPTSRAFDAYKGKHVSVKCNYLRFDREAPAAPEAEIPEKDLLEHYEKNRQTFEEPTRKTVEYLYARVEDLTRRVKLTAEEKRAFYEAEKANLFRAPPAEKKADEAPGEKKAEAPGGEKKEEGGAGEKKAEPGEGEKKGEAAPAEKKAEEGAAEKKAEAPAPAFKPFEDPEVQAEVSRRLSDRAARVFLEALMNRLSKTLKGLEEEIRRKAHDYPEMNQEIRTQVSFERVARNISEDPEWTGPFAGYRPQVVRDEQFRTKAEFSAAHGSAGPRLAEKVWDLPPLIPSDSVAVPDGYVVFWALDYKPSAVPPFVDVRKKVEEDLRLSRALAAAREKAEAVRKKADASSLEAAAQEAGLKVLSTGFFRANSTTVPGTADSPSPGEAPAFVSNAFAMQGAQVSRPFEERGLKAVFLLQVTERKTPDPWEMSDRDRDQLADEQKRQAWEALSRPWGDDFRKHHKVDDRTRDRDSR